MLLIDTSLQKHTHTNITNKMPFSTRTRLKKKTFFFQKYFIIFLKVINYIYLPKRKKNNI